MDNLLIITLHYIINVIAYCCFQSLEATISAFNEILKVAVDLEKGKMKTLIYFPFTWYIQFHYQLFYESDIPENKRNWTNKMKSFDVSPLLALAVVPVGGFGPLLVALSAQYAQIGCTHYIITA